MQCAVMKSSAAVRGGICNLRSVVACSIVEYCVLRRCVREFFNCVVFSVVLKRWDDASIVKEVFIGCSRVRLRESLWTYLTDAWVRRMNI